MGTKATSISDVDSYRSVCRLAAWHESCFRAFRRHPDYSLVDGLDAPSGRQYLDQVLKDAPEIRELLPRFQEADKIGGPILAHYEEVGAFSPSTLRYVKISNDIKQRFGGLRGAKIAEIGAGYGGQCRALHVLCPEIASYTIYDLPEPMSLAQRFLARLDLTAVDFSDVFTAAPTEYDLVISNYAIGELNKATQDIYLEKVIKGSKSGFMIYNAADFEKSLPGYTYSRGELLEKIPGSRVIEAADMLEADGRYGNVLIYW